MKRAACVHCSTLFYKGTCASVDLGPGTNPLWKPRNDYSEGFRESKLIRGFSTAWGVGTPDPHVLQGSICTLYLDAKRWQIIFK